MSYLYTSFLSKLLFFLSLLSLALGIAFPSTVTQASISTSRTTVSLPLGTVVGSIVDDVEYFRGIPFAQAPTGSLRLQPPVAVSTFSEPVFATASGPSCPQMTNVDITSAVEEVSQIPEMKAALAILEDAPDVTEDCLTVSVMRPLNTEANASLPVLVWFFGGGFETGSPAGYNGSILIPRSVAQGMPMLLVTLNYRLGGFGFLPGSEILSSGIANLGLRDQRLGLEWIADHIAGFGGDPEKVTIWGQSAGSMSVLDQMAMYGGNITYKQKPLFRAGIMNSGTIYPAASVDAPQAQAIFDTVVSSAGCASVPSDQQLQCLRNLSFEEYYNATNSVPSPFSYNSPVSSFLARPDGLIMPASGEIVAREQLYAPVPVIVGDQEDEGTFLSLTQNNLTTHSDLLHFLTTHTFPNATASQITSLIATYPYDNGAGGSPFNTGSTNQLYPQYKRLAAILGDTTFIMLRRYFLSTAPRSMKTWSYLATYGHDIRDLGTFHTLDLPHLFYGTDGISRAMQARYIAFVARGDPNEGIPFVREDEEEEAFGTEWPLWRGDGNGKEERWLMRFGRNETGLLRDDFRRESYAFISEHLEALRW